MLAKTLKSFRASIRLRLNLLCQDGSVSFSGFGSRTIVRLFAHFPLQNVHNVWFRISWLRIHSHAEFRLPRSLDADQPAAGIEIDFTRNLRIRRFRFWIADETVYDEVH